MPNNRYLEFIKRLLSAETYFRSREQAKEREANEIEPEPRPPEEDCAGLTRPSELLAAVMRPSDTSTAGSG
jgi:hypothetical protein